MAVTFKTLVDGQHVAGSNTLYYTVPAGVRAKISRVTLVNTDTANQTVSVYFVPNGGSAGDSNAVLKTKSLAPNETYPAYELVGHVLEAGDMIYAGASAASKVAMMVSGVEVS